MAELRDCIIYRFPKKVCDALCVPVFDKQKRKIGDCTGLRADARHSAGCELRFASSSDKIKLTLETQNGAEITVYRGDYLIDRVFAIAGESSHIFFQTFRLGWIKRRKSKQVFTEYMENIRIWSGKYKNRIVDAERGTEAAFF